MEKVKRNILIIGERFYPEEFLINDLVKHLQENDFSCTVITQQPSYPIGIIFSGYKNKLFSEDSNLGAKVHRVSFIKGYNKNVFFKLINYFWFVFWGIVLVLFKVKSTDKIIVYQTGPLTQALIGIVAKWKFKKSLYIWTWDIWPDSVFGYGFAKNFITSKILDTFVRFVYKKCDFIWISSPGFGEVIKRYTDKVCFEVPNWVVEEQSVENVKLEFKEGFHFTFTGNIGQVQNLENVILGFGQAFANNHNVFLNLVGDGSNIAKLKALVKREQFNNVIFWGKRPFSEMKSFYSKSHVLIISLKQGSVWNLYLPSKFQNYLHEKIPLFGVIDGTVKDLILKYRLGVCASPNDLGDIKINFIETYNNYNYFRQNALLNSDKLIVKFDGNIIKSFITNELKQ